MHVMQALQIIVMLCSSEPHQAQCHSNYLTCMKEVIETQQITVDEGLKQCIVQDVERSKAEREQVKKDQFLYFRYKK